MDMSSEFVAIIVVTIIIGVAIVFYYIEDSSLAYLN